MESLDLWVMWVAIALVCAIAEMITAGFFIMCFSVGALVALPFSFFDVPAVWQWVIFAVASTVAVFLVRPFAVRYLRNKRTKETVSNADAILGKICTVSEAIPEKGYGRVKLGGDDWKAVSADGSALAEGERVRIVARESLIVTVEAAQ